MTYQYPSPRAFAFALCVVAALSTLLLCVVLAPAPALALPEGRVYEMVTPPYKGGYAAEGIDGVAENGEAVVFESLGAFAGQPYSEGGRNTYLARRGASGWSSSPLNPPAALTPNVVEPVAFSANLESTLFLALRGPNYGAAQDGSVEQEFLSYQTGTPDTSADWMLQGEVLEGLNKESNDAIKFEGASPSISHMLFTGGSEDPLLPVPEGAGIQLYDFAVSREGVSSLGLVGVNNRGQGEVIDPDCFTSAWLGAEASSGPNYQFNAVAAGGEEIFFTTNVEPGQGTSCERNPSNPEQLFVRVGGSRTLEVSRPLESSKAFGGCESGGAPGEVPCSGAAGRASAEFDGASKDGSKVFFTTAAPLVGEDEDSTNDLYLASIGCPSGVGEACAAAGEAANTKVESLVQVSHDPNPGEAADVQGVIRVAPDGSRVYFVARGVLTGAASAGAQGYAADGEAVGSGAVAQPGADNLYVFDAETNETSFIADLCSGAGRSGELSDDACPLGLGQSENDAGLWLAHIAETQTASGSGGFLVFSSYGRLAANDTDNARDVYRYDAETGALDRVSIGEDGYDANGNSNGFDATIGTEAGQRAFSDTRVISEDGSRVVFTTAEPLSAQAVNRLANVYEWQIEPGWSEGKVSLISTGSASEPVTRVTISPSGNDVFFVTSQGLVPQDTDGEDDVYDARLGGGFPPAPAPARECSGDACQGPLTNPAPLLMPGSVSQAPGQNFAGPAPATATTPKRKATPKCAKGKQRRHDVCVKAKTKQKRQKVKAKKAGDKRKGRS